MSRIGNQWDPGDPPEIDGPTFENVSVRELSKEYLDMLNIRAMYKDTIIRELDKHGAATLVNHEGLTVRQIIQKTRL